MTPQEQAAAGRLATSHLRHVVARWRGSGARAKRARHLASLDNRLDRWADLATTLHRVDESAVLRAVLACDPAHGHRSASDAPKHARPPVGVTVGGEVFLAIPIPDAEDEIPQCGVGSCDRMMLVVVPADAIRRVDEELAIEAYAPSRPEASTTVSP